MGNFIFFFLLGLLSSFLSIHVLEPLLAPIVGFNMGIILSILTALVMCVVAIWFKTLVSKKVST